MVLFDRLRTTGFINDDPMSYAEMLELMDGPVVCKLSTSSGFIGSLNFHIKTFPRKQRTFEYDRKTSATGQPSQAHFM